MSTRGSLKQCVSDMCTLFHQGRYDSLAVLHNSRGKYYTLYTPDELQKKATLSGDGHLRLVLNCSLKELRSIALNDQLNIFDGTP